MIDDHDRAQHVFQLRDVVFHLGLLVLRFVVFGVFAQVAVAAGDLNLLGNFLAFYQLIVIQLFFQLGIALRRYNGTISLRRIIRHCHCSFHAAALGRAACH